MTSYSELMAQAQALMAQAEQARKNELASVIADIKAKMKQYGISVADLGVLGANPARPNPALLPNTVAPTVSCGRAVLVASLSGCAAPWHKARISKISVFESFWDCYKGVCMTPFSLIAPCDLAATI